MNYALILAENGKRTKQPVIALKTKIIIRTHENAKIPTQKKYAKHLVAIGMAKNVNATKIKV